MYERNSQCPLIRNSYQRLLVINHSNSRQSCWHGYHRRSDTVLDQIRKQNMYEHLTKIRSYLIEPAQISKLDYIIILAIVVAAAWN